MSERFIERIEGVTRITRHVFAIHLDHGHTTPPIPVERRQHLHVLFRQAEVSNLMDTIYNQLWFTEIFPTTTTYQIVLDSLWSNTFWKNCCTPFHLVSNKHLSGRFAIFLSNFNDLGVLQEQWLSQFGPWPVRRTQRTISLKHHTLLLHVSY